MKKLNRKFGIELEYYGTPNDHAIDEVKWESCSDGSIDVGGGDGDDYEDFELVSRVYKSSELKKLVSDFNKLKKGCIMNQNSSCGFHVHFSGRELDYLTMKQAYDFPKFFVQQLKVAKRGATSRTLKHFLSRSLARIDCGEFCALEEIDNEEEFEDFIEDARCENGERYQCVNYQALGKHGTIEFRCFPSTVLKSNVEFAPRFVLKSIQKYVREVLKPRLKRK